MAILARLAFSTPVHLDQVVYEGIEHLTGEDMEYAKEFGLGLKLIGTAERVDGGISVRVHPAFLYAGHPLAVGPRPVQRGHAGVRHDHRGDAVGAGRGRPADRDRGARRRRLGDDPARLDAGDDRGADRWSTTSSRRSTCTWRSPTGPGVLAQVAELLGMQGASIRSVVQKGLGENARLVMILHPLLESRFYAAVRMIGQLDFIRSAPRAIRVIDEEFDLTVPA